MKFKDIPQLTRIGSYQTNISLNYLLECITEYQKMGLNSCPDFQRGHVWSNKLRTQFVEFLLKGGNTNNVIYFNHPGWMRSYEGDFVLVDGLQRLTACIKFMNNELKAFGSYFKEYEDKMYSLTGLVFNVNNLKTTKEVLMWYLEMNSGHISHSKKNLDYVRELLRLEEER